MIIKDFSSFIMIIVMWMSRLRFWENKPSEPQLKKTQTDTDTQGWLNDTLFHLFTSKSLKQTCTNFKTAVFLILLVFLTLGKEIKQANDKTQIKNILFLLKKNDKRNSYLHIFLSVNVYTSEAHYTGSQLIPSGPTAVSLILNLQARLGCEDNRGNSRAKTSSPLPLPHSHMQYHHQVAPQTT